MSVRKLGARVEIDGAAEYKATLQALSRENAVYGSALDMLAEKYKDASDKTEFYTQRGKLLEEQLTVQAAKVVQLRQAVEEAEAQTGKNSDTTAEWQVKLNNAEKEEWKLQNAIDANNKALEENSAAMGGNSENLVGLGDAADKVAGKLGINIPDGAKEALNGVAEFSAGTVAGMAAAAAAITAVVEVAEKLSDVTLEAAAKADTLITDSMVSGVSTETLQKWTYAQELIDVSVDTMTGSLSRLTNSIYDAANGNEKLMAAFDKLGVQIQDTATGHLRQSEDVFYDVIDALGNMRDSTERDAVAMDLLGKSAQQLNPLLLQGSEALRDVGEAAMESGYVLDKYQIEKLAEVDEAYQEMKLTVSAFTNELALGAAPLLEFAMNRFTDSVEVAKAAVGWLGDAMYSLLDVFGLVESRMQGFNSLGEDIFGASWKSDVNAWVSAGGSIITPGNYGDFDKRTGKPTREFYLGELMPYESPARYETWSEEDIQRLLYSAGHNAQGTQYWRGGPTWVGELGPELVDLPKGSRIYSNQESREIAQSATDVSPIEAKLSRIESWLEKVTYALEDGEAVRRMA